MDPETTTKPAQGWRSHVVEPLLQDMEIEAPEVVALADKLQEQIGGDRMLVPLMHRGVELKMLSSFDFEVMLSKLLHACHLDPVPAKSEKTCES